MKPEILREIRTLITPPEAWTTGFAARDANGEEIEPCEPDAVCWCVIGAIERVVGTDVIANGLIDRLIDRVRAMPDHKAKDGWVLSNFNDTQGHTAVLALLDAELAELEGTHGA